MSAAEEKAGGISMRAMMAGKASPRERQEHGGLMLRAEGCRTSDRGDALSGHRPAQGVTKKRALVKTKERL